MTVSDNDLQSISQGDAEGMEVQTLQEDFSVPGNTLQDIKNTNVAILFVIIAIWVESRIRNGIWRFFGSGKSD